MGASGSGGRSLELFGSEFQMMLAAYAAPNDQYAEYVEIGSAILSTIRLRDQAQQP